MEIRRVGFFHFASDTNGDPIKALEDTLNKAKVQDDAEARKGFTESLLVIPEAFNLRFDYFDPRSRTIDCGVRGCLIELSQRHKIAIVAGFLDNHGESLCHNCAYLIDEGELKKLSRKELSDGSDNYYVGSPSDRLDDVIEYRGLRIVALVCMDADRGYIDQGERHEEILNKLNGAGHKILCTPSCFSRSRKPVNEIVAGYVD